MASATLREIHATLLPLPPAPRADDWDWIYDDPDLAPFLAARRPRKETPLTAWA